MKYTYDMINTNRIALEASLMFAGVFIFGALFGAITWQTQHVNDVEVRIMDQCHKFGAFYVDENTKYFCEKVEGNN